MANIKRVLTLDFETRFSKKPCSWTATPYSLSVMTTEEYVRDARFKAFGMCVHELNSDVPTKWYSGKDIAKFLNTVDWTTTAVLAHNAMFDVSILSMRYGIEPAFVIDSLSMARAVRGANGGNSLFILAREFGLPPKGDALHSTDGLYELSPEIEAELADYCAHDVFLCEAIYKRLRYLPDGRKFPAGEMALIDLTLKMFTQPVLELDVDMLEKAVKEDEAKLAAALARVGATESMLASNPQFADVLLSMGIVPPTKASKTTGKPTYAFAKNDAMFQAMLNGDNEDLALLCEARLRVKSTLERTRAKRFIDIAGRGCLPIPLYYYGAHSGRWSATGKINMQNMKRGSFLRKAICAPEGYHIVVGDLSQIEPRVLAWLADYDDMLDTFRSGADPYATFGAQMFGIPGMTKESHPLLRQSAKSALLGCFGSSTPVLTKRGWVNIVDVSTEDLLWDGLEWVKHQGLLEQGEKETLTQYGVSATSDHEILTAHGWAEWSEVLADPSLFLSALDLVKLPACDGTPVTPTKKSAGTQCSLGSAVHVGGKATSTGGICVADGQRGATPAPKRKPRLPAWLQRAWRRCVQTGLSATDCSTASVPSLSAAQTQSLPHTPTTAGAASSFTQRGLKIAKRFCSTLWASTGTTSRIYSWTAGTTTADMNRVICALSRVAQTCQTNDASRQGRLSSCADASQPLRQRMQTYDIAMAGPRNRFTILTDSGPLIVHNCGYQLGWASFAAQLLVGFLGAPPQRYTPQDAKQLGVTRQDVYDFMHNEDFMTAMRAIAHTCTEAELLIHCVSARAIVLKYRAAAEPVTKFWKMLGELLVYSLLDGNEVTYKCMTFRKGEILLPNGMSLRYPDIKVDYDEKNRPSYTYWDGKKRVRLYAGKLANNVTQALARIIMTDGMRRAAKRYRPLFTVHDEFGVLAPDAEAKEAVEFIEKTMTVVPTWMPGIPLASDVGAAKRYGLVK